MKAAMDGPIAMTSGAMPAYQGNQLNTKVRMKKNAHLIPIDKSFHDDFLFLVFGLTVLLFVLLLSCSFSFSYLYIS